MRKPKRLLKAEMGRCGHRGRTAQLVSVTGRSQSGVHGLLRFGGLLFHCAAGRSGRRVSKREGDGATPVGTWHLRWVYYRPDRVARPRTGLPVKPIRRTDGWCDAPADPNYNRPVRYPYPVSAERLWRDDGLYDIVVVLGYNDRPRMRNRGSAIFMHVASSRFDATAGCIALPRTQLMALLERLGPRARMRILP